MKSVEARLHAFCIALCYLDQRYHFDYERPPNMQYRHEIAEAAVEALTAADTDPTIAMALADYLLAGVCYPIKLSLNHNAKAAPCPVRIDRPGLKQSSVTLTAADTARMWIIDALSRGYEVTTTTQRGQETKSIAAIRKTIAWKQEMAEWRAKRGAGGAYDDDDQIPF